MKTIKGQKLVRIQSTFNRHFDAYDDRGNHYKIPPTTVLSMVNEFVFAKEKKRVHTHLTVDWPATEAREAHHE